MESGTVFKVNSSTGSALHKSNFPHRSGCRLPGLTVQESRKAEKPFSTSVICGELILWMAEVSGAVEKSQLEKMVNQIVESADLSRGNKPVYDRRKWNREIYNLCFDRIMHLNM